MSKTSPMIILLPAAVVLLVLLFSWRACTQGVSDSAPSPTLNEGGTASSRSVKRDSNVGIPSIDKQKSLNSRNLKIEVSPATAIPGTNAGLGRSGLSNPDKDSRFVSKTGVTTNRGGGTGSEAASPKETLIRKKDASAVYTTETGETRAVTNVRNGITNVFLEFRQGKNRKWVRLNGSQSMDEKDPDADPVTGVEKDVKYYRLSN